jgi:hypothetical protein
MRWLQDVGMLNQSRDLPAVKDMLRTANRELGYDLLEVCSKGECLLMNQVFL